MDGVITLTMRPECLVSGRFVCAAPAKQKSLAWPNVYLGLDGKGAMACAAPEQTFHFFVRPGTYGLRAYVDKAGTGHRSIEVEAGPHAVQLGSLDLSAPVPT